MAGQSLVTNDFVSLRDAMNQLFEESFTPFWASTRGRNGVGAQALPLDVYATAEDVYVIAAVPGMRPDDVEVSVNQGVVTISGTLQNAADAEEAQGATWYLHELAHGQFRRSVSLPIDVDAAKADATFADGILKLRLPKAEQAKPRRIEVRVGGINSNEPAAVEAGTSSKQR